MDVLTQHRQVWDSKPILREIYQEWYRMIQRDLRISARPALEIGAGTGNFKAYQPGVIATDIVFCDWLDVCLDAHRIPFADRSLANIVMFDVLHHLADPLGFIDEALRVLEPGGRIILLEPYPSPFSLQVYRRFHPEPFRFEADYFSAGAGPRAKDPWDANQAIAYLLFFRHRQRFAQRYQGRLTLARLELTSFLRYPLSGGFTRPAFYPQAAVPLLKGAETLLAPLAKLLAFRCYVVLSKQAG